MKTQYYTATSLDGYIATEDNSLDWLFKLGDVTDNSYPSFIENVGALAMGSNTYEWMLHNAEVVKEQTGSPWPYSQPTWVFSSRTLPRITNANLHFVNGDVSKVHSSMRAAAGNKNIWIVGVGDLAGQFYDAGHLDEMIIQVASITLGKGKPLFPRRHTTPALKLTSAKQVGDNFVELRYTIPKAAPTVAA